MITKESVQMTNVCFTVNAEPKHALIQGAPSRLRIATVIVPAMGGVKLTPVSTDASYGGQGSRAWSPPV